MRKDDHCGNHISSKIQRLSALPCSAGSYMSATDSSKREGKPPRKKRGLMQTPAVLFSVCRLSGGGLSAGGDKLEAEHQQLIKDLLSTFLCYQQAVGWVAFQHYSVLIHPSVLTFTSRHDGRDGGMA